MYLSHPPSLFKVTRAPRYAARSPLRVDSLSELEDESDGRSSIGASPHVYGYKSPVVSLFVSWKYSTFNALFPFVHI